MVLKCQSCFNTYIPQARKFSIFFKITGCGLQETFKNCADISILTNDGARPPPAQQVPPEKMVLVRDIKSGNLIPLVVRQVSFTLYSIYGNPNYHA